jgi:hypothetical protein
MNGYWKSRKIKRLVRRGVPYKRNKGKEGNKRSRE